MPVQSMTQPLPLRSRSFVISAFVISVVLTFIFYTEFVHDHFSLRDLPKIGNQIFARPPVVSEIPKKLWYKLGPKGITDDVFEWTGTCIRQNPAYQFQFMTDDWADEYVERTFSNTRPDIVEVYLKLKIPIVKADLLRYLVLYVEGGVWSDLDVSCEGIPIDEWVPEAYKHNASLVVGWEFDYGWDGAFFHQFASWTILSRPGVRHMLMVIDDIVKSVHLVSLYHEVPIEELTKAMVGDIVDFTGPRRLTQSIIKSLELTLGKDIDHHDIENIRDPVLIDNALILPGYAFSVMTNHFEDIGGPPGPALVTHHYAGSWKNENGGELAQRSPRRAVTTG